MLNNYLRLATRSFRAEIQLLVCKRLSSKIIWLAKLSPLEYLEFSWNYSTQQNLGSTCTCTTHPQTTKRGCARIHAGSYLNATFLIVTCDHEDDRWWQWNSVPVQVAFQTTPMWEFCAMMRGRNAKQLDETSHWASVGVNIKRWVGEHHTAQDPKRRSIVFFSSMLHISEQRSLA